MKIALLGHMGRDEALAERLVLNHELHVIGQWENPGLVEKAAASGGSYMLVDNIANVTAIGEFVQELSPDMFLTNFDDALAAGVVDDIQERVASKQMPELLLPCPNKDAAQVEWDKFFLRELIAEIDPDYNPANFMVDSPEKVDTAIDFFRQMQMEIVIKPRNLTGGKGVKVQGKHFDTYEVAKAYALEVLADNKQSGLEIQEKLIGHEFTLQLFTDSKTMVLPPETYDYPYREDGDQGPGTGGMGTFSFKWGDHLPFVSDADYVNAVLLMQALLDKLRERNLDYKGVLYPTFFKTEHGLKIVEVNARGGDPELINILDLVNDNIDMGQVLKLIAQGELAKDNITYKKAASAMIYLVSPDYGYRQGPAYEFEMDPKLAESHYVNIRFAAAKKLGNKRYQTVGSSRTVGLSSLASTPWNARENVHAFINQAFGQPLPLDFRQDIAKQEYIETLKVGK